MEREHAREDVVTVPSPWDEGKPLLSRAPPSLIPIDEALSHIFSCTNVVEGIENVPILDALGRVLAEDVVSPMNVPPFDRAAMDGYAVRASDTRGASEESPATLRVVGELEAGSASTLKVGAGDAIRIMTGALLPAGADAVVMVERTRPREDQVEILYESKEGKHVALCGENLRAGEIAVTKGSVIRPPEVGMLASIGIGRIPVHRRPRIAIISTGGEIEDLDEGLRLSPGKIWDANRYFIASQVSRAGGIPILLPTARDNQDELTSRLEEGLKADAIVTSGGVSMGKFDLVTRTLDEIGELIFWKVSMKPGKPVAFGRIGTSPVLGLPGNPLAAMIAFELFGRPMVLRLSGRKQYQRPSVKAVLETGLKREAKKTRIIAVSLSLSAGTYIARMAAGRHGSSRLLSMMGSHGLAVIPPGNDPLEAGSEVDVLLMDSLDNLP